MAVWWSNDGAASWRAAQAVTLLGWMASLMPPHLRGPALAELGGAERIAATAEELAGPYARPARRAAGPPAADAGDPVDRLRAARTVLACDAVLAAAPPDWPALAAAHDRRPFGRDQRRALIARPDCPDRFTATLLTPWDSRVANRLVARQQELPDWAWRPGLARIGELRPSLLRHVLAGTTAAELLHGTPRLDLLVRVVDAYDHNHHRQVQGFWDAVGTALRAGIGADPQVWRTAATRLPGYRGSLRALLASLARRQARADDSGLPDLRVLVLAPPETLAALVAELSDAELARAAEHPLRRLRAREHFARTVVDRLREAGVPPRALFARWACGARGRARGTQAWLHGLDGLLDRYLDGVALTDLELRRLLADRRPPRPPAEDLVTELRRCDGAVEAQAVVDSTCGPTGSPQWTELVRAHEAAPLPEQVLCVLATRAGFPDSLAHALPPGRLFDLIAHGPATARAALASLAGTSLALDRIDTVRRLRVLDDRAALDAVRPAREALHYGYRRRHSAPQVSDPWVALCTALLEQAATGAGPGFWRELADRLADFDDSLPELLADTRRRGTVPQVAVGGGRPGRRVTGLGEHRHSGHR